MIQHTDLVKQNLEAIIMSPSYATAPPESHFLDTTALISYSSDTGNRRGFEISISTPAGGGGEVPDYRE